MRLSHRENGRQQVIEQKKQMEKVKKAHSTGGKQMNYSISRADYCYMCYSKQFPH